MRIYNTPVSYPYNVFTGISENDTMFNNNPQHYYNVGLSAIHCIEKSLLIANKKGSSVLNILDMPSGYGRVARTLKARFPKSSLTVCDIDKAGVDFCVDNMGAVGVYSDNDFSKINFKTRFDLIWVGSLITHFPKHLTIRFLDFLTSLLEKNGIAVISSHGPYVAGRFVGSKPNGAYGIVHSDANIIVSDYFKEGYGYANYPGGEDFGISVINKSWLENISIGNDCKLIGYWDHAWDKHQDILVILKKQRSFFHI